MGKNIGVEGILLICKKVGCKYSWNYQGNSKFWASCPRCKTPIKVNTGENKK